MATDFSRLKDSDLELLDLLAKGLGDKEIGARLFVSATTIPVRLVTVKKNLGVVGNRCLLVSEFVKWQIATEGIVGIVREWLEAREAVTEMQNENN